MSEKFIINGLILAAGMSSRMGDFKPFLPLNGRTLIENTVDGMIAGGADKVVVVIGYRADEIKKLLQKRYNNKIIFATNEKYEKTDMFCSVKIGIKAMPFCNAFFFCRVICRLYRLIHLKKYPTIDKRLKRSKKALFFLH